MHVICTLVLLFTFAIGNVWGEVVGKNTSTTGTIIYSNINSTGSSVNLTAGTEENGFNAISGASFKSGPGVISVAADGYFALCVDDITEGTVYHTMTVTSNVPDWTSTSGGSNGRYAQLYIGDTGAKKYLYTKYSTNTTVEEATGLTKEGSNVRGIYSFSFTSSDLTTIGTKKYLKFKALGGEYKPAGFKIVASTTPAVDTQAPTLSSSDPEDGDTDVAVEGTIVLTFSEALASVDGTKFSLSGATIGTVAKDGSDATKVNVPYSGAANSATVTLSVAAEAVADAAGNKSAALSAISFTTVAAVTPACPSGLSISGTKDYTEGETISLNAALSEGNGEITYNWYKGADLATAKAAGSIDTGTSFSKASCTTSDAGNYFCVATKDACSDAESTAYVVTVEALVACYAYVAPLDQTTTFHEGDVISSLAGGEITVYSEAKNSDSSSKNGINYTNAGLALTKGADDRIKVTLNHLMQVGTVITINMTSGTGSSNPRGLYLKNELNANVKDSENQNVLFGWATTPAASETQTYTYTVRAGDGLAGKNIFILQRQNTVYIRSISVSNCGGELLELSSAIDPVHDPAYATVTLSKTLLAAGGTATATYSAIDPAYDFDEWQISGTGATLSSTTANPTTITMGSTDAVVTLKLKAASVKHTVTYYDGEAILANKLGEEEITEGGNPTGAGLAPKKRGYTFGGWSTTNGGTAIADYAAVTVNADMNLFAVWTPVACPANGTVFAFEMNNSAKPGGDVKAPQKGTLVIDEYLTETGHGSVLIGNTTGNNNQYAKVTSTPNINLSGTTGYLNLALECALQAGDIITIAKNNTQIYISDEAGTSGPTGNKYTTASNSENVIIVGANATTAAWVDAMDLYFWYKGGGVNITGVSVVRPYTVSFNLNGQSATAIEDQKIAAGGKVTKPDDPVVTGQAFGGWFTDAACSEGKEWAFATATVSEDVVLYAKWTALPKMILNRGAATTGDAVVSYPTVGDPVAVPACPFTYEGYIFAGWVYSPSVTVEAGSFTMPNEDLTLTAQWVDATSVARIGSNYYATLADALLHAADGEIVLLQDIDVTAQVEIAAGVTATIDLAGHKIEYTGSTTLSSGVILVHNGASLTINDSSDPDAGSIVSGDKAYAAVALTKLGDDASTPATLVVNGGALTGYYYGITGNGSRNNTVISINGGTITGTVGIAIYHPQVGTLTVNDGSLTGVDAAIEMRAGTLVINDGTFTATATEFSCNPNGSGSTTSGAAIAIAQHTTKKDIEVTINGGTFNGVKALNESNPQVNDPAPQVTMAVTAGTFTGEVTTVDVDKFISGGSFSEPVAEENCATGYVPETKANGKYGVIVPAQSIDFEAIIDAKGTDATAIAELDAQLAAKHYDIDGTLNDDRLDAPTGKPQDKGFKVKKTGLTISFSVEKEKVVEITTGHISGASIKVDAEDAVVMTASHTHTYYNDDAQAFLITMTATGNAYNIFKSINIRDPYKVSFDVNGGDAPIAPRFATPSVTLPDATNGTQNFAGWYTDADVFVGMNGDSYTPTADITLVAHWEALSTINTLSDLKVDGATVDGFDADVHTYYIELPYGTDVSNLPKITAATPTNANATVNIYPAAGPEWTDDFGGCYRQQANVTPQDPAAAIGYNDIRITIAPKDPLCIIKAEHDGTATGATVTGFYGGTKDKKTANNGKLGDANQYFGIKLAEEAGTFKAGDVLKIYATNPSAAVRIYSDKGTTRINATDGTFDSEKMFTYTLTGDEEWIYLYRRYKETETDMNPTLGYMAVYRPVPNPLVKTITFNGAVATVDNTASPKTITVEVPASTTLATMPVVATFYSNDPSQTSGAVTGGTWAEGTNEYIVTDKDNDQTVYTVTITKAVPSSDATLSALSYGTPATAIALADGIYEYDVLLPYGTSDVPALAATAHHAGATIESIDNATAFVDRKATLTVTVKAEDNATTQVYTVNFTVDRFESKVLWDGATMTSFDDAVAAATAAGVSIVNVGDQSVQSKSSSFEDKNYTKCIQYAGATSASRNFGISVPAGKVAKVSIVYRPRSNGERSIIIGTDVAGAINESAIVYATTTHDHLDRLTADIFAAGTIYINTTNGYQVFEINVQLADGYGRSAMLGAGVLGTVCVPNNVTIEDIQGVTVYELMGRESQYGKLAFDEIISGELEAGVPYVFQAHRNHMALLYGEDNVADPVDKHNGMYGTFTDKVLTELNDVYYFAQKALWGCADLASLNVPANRAYVKLNEVGSVASSVPAPGRRRISMAVNGEQVATGIENTGFESEAPRKVLINGELYIIRGEKMYDAKGQLVK